MTPMPILALDSITRVSTERGRAVVRVYIHDSVTVTVHRNPRTRPLYEYASLMSYAPLMSVSVDPWARPRT
jgi:hypothetical protein